MKYTSTKYTVEARKYDADLLWYKEGTKILHREDGPAVEHADGYKEWHIDGRLHREDGPAIIYPTGTKEWRIDGRLHREDGPAIEYANGDKVWYLNGKCLSEEEHQKEVGKLKTSYNNKIVKMDGKKYKLVLIEQ